MVNNAHKILDAGEIKILPHNKYMPNYLDVQTNYQRDYNNYKTKLDELNKYLTIQRNNEMIQKKIDELSNDKNIDIYESFHEIEKLKKSLEKIPKQCPTIPLEMRDPSDMTTDDILKFYNIEKFTKCWMLNVSPDWKGKKINLSMIAHFITVIEAFYGNCNRFTKYRYVLENGHGEDHLHAHIVFELNENKPGYMTPIRKAKILTEWRNCWNRLSRENSYPHFIDLCKNKYALNTCLLTNKQMLLDKLDYLIEDLKPISHKNDPHSLCPVSGGDGWVK